MAGADFYLRMTAICSEKDAELSQRKVKDDQWAIISFARLTLNRSFTLSMLPSSQTCLVCSIRRKMMVSCRSKSNLKPFTRKLRKWKEII